MSAEGAVRNEASPAAGNWGSAGATVSVVVPAHNEARTLVRTLSALRASSTNETAEVIVVANGCSDDTAEVARRAGAIVVELGQASKAQALRAGDERATTFPRIYLDADIRLTPGTLDGLAASLRGPRALVASPAVVFDTSASSWAVRAFYRAYREIPYIRQGLIGLGVYGVSGSGRSRFGTFPDVTGDDLFVQRLFAVDERRTAPGEFIVEAPRDLRNLLKVRVRIARGNAELAKYIASDAQGTVDQAFERSTTSTARSLLRRLAGRPSNLPDIAIFVAVGLFTRVAAGREQGSAWHRDDSTR